MEVREINEGDHEAILALNLESEWALSPLDAHKLVSLAAICEHALVVDLDGTVAGFALALAPGAAYDSPYFRWFSARYEEFLYLDRIAVAAAARRRGVGSALYEAMEQRARRRGRMLCEVNYEPPNEASLAFHEARGYRRIDTFSADGAKVVVMLERSFS